MSNLIKQAIIQREDLRENPHVIYIFGDNCARYGLGGQARAMRGEPNAIGIRTKRKPTREHDAYFSDDDFSAVSAYWQDDFAPVEAHLRAGGVVVVPLDGIGTGLANLGERAPRLAALLKEKIENLTTVTA